MIRENIATPEMKRAGATIGTKPWAEYRKQKLEEAVDQAIGGKIKFTAEVFHFIDSESWRHFLDATGAPFATFEAFCLHKRPYGLGCRRDDYTMLNAPKNKFGTWEGRSAPGILRMTHEKTQYEIAVDLDIPHHKCNSEDVLQLLDAIAQAVERAVESNENLMSRMRALKIDYCGVRVER